MFTYLVLCRVEELWYVSGVPEVAVGGRRDLSAILNDYGRGGWQVVAASGAPYLHEIVLMHASPSGGRGDSRRGAKQPTVAG